LPEITFKTEFYDEQAEKIKACFSPGVIKIVDDDKKEGNLFILFNRMIKILISKIKLNYVIEQLKAERKR
jgi:hypothetical protein